MTERLSVAPSPCATCPYARSTPRGIWDPSEYAKLAEYDADPCLLPPFLCHETALRSPRGVCKGWLLVHRDSVAVRLACARGAIDAGDVPAPDTDVSRLYRSGAAAARAGLRGVARPSGDARAAIDGIRERRNRRLRGRGEGGAR